MTTELNFFVPGDPAAQGSKRHVGNGHMVEMSKNLKPWRDSVIYMAREAHTGAPWDGPMELQVTFWFPRPKSAKKAMSRKVSAPDLDKLVRSIGDSLKLAGVIVDDSRLTDIHAYKRLLPAEGGTCGADVTLSRLEEA